MSYTTTNKLSHFGGKTCSNQCATDTAITGHHDIDTKRRVRGAYGVGTLLLVQLLVPYSGACSLLLPALCRPYNAFIV